MEMNKPIIALSMMFIVFLMTPTLVLAQSLNSDQVVDFLWVKTFGFEKAWLNQPNKIILEVILPTIAIYAIFLGLVRTIGVFSGMGESMEHVIALVVALSALFMGVIGWVSGVLAGLGVFSFAIFVLLFLVGSLLYAKGFIHKRSAMSRIESDYKKNERNIQSKINGIENKIDKLEIEMGGKTGDAKNKLMEKITGLELRRKKLRKELRMITESVLDIPE